MEVNDYLTNHTTRGGQLRRFGLLSNPNVRRTLFADEVAPATAQQLSNAVTVNEATNETTQTSKPAKSQTITPSR